MIGKRDAQKAGSTPDPDVGEASENIALCRVSVPTIRVEDQTDGVETFQLTGVDEMTQQQSQTCVE